MRDEFKNVDGRVGIAGFCDWGDSDGL